MNPFSLSDIIRNALAEDLGDGDHSALSCIPENARSKAKLLVKEPGIIAGLEVAKMVAHEVDPTLSINLLKKDGEWVNSGEIAFFIEGNSRSLLSAERIILNLMQRMSGIATQTHRITQLISHTKCRVLDTRKTVPGLRAFDKWAVKIGGGVNHRFGLFDMIMIKDNHADYAGGLANAIQNCKNYLQKTGKDLLIEVETRNLEEIDIALQAGGIHRIMFDNFDFETMKKAVQRVNGLCETEASGGITEENVVQFAETGVDFVSMGCLTHTVRNLDLSLKAV
ncbi:MAG: carboxylating nicotinate-nucleotide diphosphorylase [Bacteroidota bacterium]